MTAPRLRRVLLVDDEPGIVDVFAAILRGFGFVVEGAGDGNVAMDLLGRNSFDVIVSDINMPGCDGLEFLRRVRERDLDVPVIMMTGKPSLETSNQAMEYGAFRYLIKPIEAGTLLDVIERALRFHDLARLKRQALELAGEDGKWLGDRAALESRFAKAMSGMWMAFQPIVSWSQRRVFGYEALLRTTEPTLPNPGAVLEAARRLGRLVELGRAIRERTASVPLPDGAALFVNLLPVDLNDGELYQPRSSLARMAKRVVLEITERTTLEEVKDLPGRVAELRRLGFRIAIDDLGAGYAGLGTFSQLEPEVVKLDMSLVRDVHVLPVKQRIIRSMRELCAELGIAVVMEGIETALERDALLALGSDLLQGYLFARPGPPFPELAGGGRRRNPGGS